jgi:hypothetical protein
MFNEEIIAIQDIILEYILSSGWKDYKNFARALTEYILEQKPIEKKVLENHLLNFSHPFYSFNEITKQRFVRGFPIDAINHRLRHMPTHEVRIQKAAYFIETIKPQPKSTASIVEIFPELATVDIATGKSLAETSLDIYERVIQDTLRDYLRERNATNISERKKDGSLEVADIEHFVLRVKGKTKSFSAVVKGYKSIGKRQNIIFEDIAHQILKANETHPEHILLIVAKPLADGVNTKIVEYGKDCGNEHLVVIMDSVNLARFLRYMKKI